MKQEPVACVYQNFGIGRVAWLTEVPPDGTKLYTHPIKDPTDEIVALLEGIDKEQNTETGWWETSTGAKFGKQKLDEIIAILKKARE